MEQQTIRLNGTGVASYAETDNGKMTFYEFLPDEQGAQVVKPAQATGMAQLMRDGTLYFTAFPPRIRNNALLICKTAHGRLSGTRDHAVQLTLKAFSAEAVDWQRAFVTETVGVITNLMGEERMIELLNKLIIDLKHNG